MTRNAGRQRGFALLLVLWTVSLLALLATQILSASRLHTQVARNALDTAVLEAAANGALQEAIFNILDGSTRHWNASGTARILRLGSATVVVQIENETDKVNPAVASPELLKALLLQVGADLTTAGSLAASIVEWRLGSGAAGRPNATFVRYQSAGRDYAPSGTPIASVDELALVLGMTPELLERLRPHLTVYTDSDPDMTTRDPVVARALAAAGQLGAGTAESGEELVSILAEARGSGRGRFTLRAVVRINARPEGRRYEILSYQRIWGGRS